MQRWFLLLVSTVLALTTQAQEIRSNGWTKATSGNWEEQYWSLGTLPNSNSMVLFTNAGFKALALSPSTRAFPDALKVYSLDVDSPPDSANTLFFNFLGVLTPFKSGWIDVRNSNSTLLCLNSRLELNSMVMEGAFRFGQFSQLAVNSLELQSGEIDMTNGTFEVGFLTMGRQTPAAFNQFGGVNTASLTEIRGNDSSYHLLNGNLDGAFLTVGKAGYDTQAAFLQQDGNVTMSDYLILGDTEASGTYMLNRGTLSARNEILGDASFGAQARGTFLQAGGTNSTSSLTVGASQAASNYSLSNGLLRTGNTSVSGRDCQFTQWSGIHNVTNELSISGVTENSQTWLSHYTMAGGQLAANNLSLSLANFVQSGGTNEVSNEVTLTPGILGSQYALGGGAFRCSSMVIQGGVGSGTFDQAGGESSIARLLQIGPGAGESEYAEAKYVFRGGTLQARNILLERYATFRINQGGLVSTGLFTFAGGRLQMGVPLAQLGQASLSASATSLVTFTTSPATLRFADSHGAALTPGSLLLIADWNGSTNGGGNHQLIFGNNAQGWSAAQLRQTLFRNPAGFPPGHYAARIVANGEIVPAKPAMFLSRSGNSFTLSWTGAFVLQTATNILGPFTNVTNLTNPYTIQTTGEKQRYFRLKN
jgi:hypothetical protein